MTRRRLLHVLRNVAARPAHAAALMLCVGTAVLSAAMVQGLAGGVGRQLDALIADWRNQRVIAAYGRSSVGPDGRRCETNTLTDGDLAALQTALGDRATFYPRLIGGALLEANGAHRQMDIRAIGTAYFRFAQWYTATGDPLTDDDEALSEKVCVLGAAIADQFFGNAATAVGKILRINGAPFRVKGVLERRGRNVTGEDLDTMLYIPVSTARKRTFCVQGLRGIGYVITDPDDDDRATGVILSTLRARHRIAPDAKDDFDIVDPRAVRRMYTGAFRTKERMIGLVTIIAALLGIAVVANVTLLAVQQRRAEIGLKRAIGATRLDVISEIVAETIVVAIGGAILGLGVFTAAWATIPRLTLVAGQLSSFPLAFSWPTALAGAGTAVAIGMIAAIIPSRAAARLEPADTLRS